MSTDFGDLRSVLQGPPGEETWTSFVNQIAPLTKGDLNEELITYCQEHLSRWPEDMLRYAPREWVRLGSGNMKAPSRWHPGMIFCTALELDDAGIDNKSATHFSKAEGLRTVRHLTLRQNMLSKGGYAALFHAPLDALVVLDLSKNYFSKGVLDLLPRLGELPNFEKLIFHGAYHEGLAGHEGAITKIAKEAGFEADILTA